MLQMDWATIKADYLHLVNTIVPGPQSWTFFVPQILLPVSLSVPPHILSHDAHARLVFPIILASTVHAVSAMRGPDVISMDTLWWSLYLLVLKDPGRDFKRVKDPKQDLRSRGFDDLQDSILFSRPSNNSKLVDWPYPSTTILRLKWTFTLLSERPLTSWKVGQVSHDARVLLPYIKQPRSKFIKDIVLILLPALLLFMPLSLQLHATEGKDMRNSSLDKLIHSQAAPRSLLHTLHRSVPAGLLQSLSLGLFLYSFLIVGFIGVYLIPPLISFLINPASGSKHTWSPHLWARPHFGPFTAVLDSGLRGLWGTWWHQQMRHAVSEPGRWLSNCLGLQKGIIRYGIICMSAFIFSGITHMGLVPPDAKDAWRLRLMIGAFFFAQPAGILVEVLVIEKVLRHLGAMMGESRSRTAIMRMLRLLWVLLFMSLPLRFLAVPFHELGYWSVWPPFFLDERIKSVLRGEWILRL